MASRKGSLTGSLVGGGPGLHIFLAEASQCGAPCSILYMPLSSRNPLLPLKGARLPSVGGTWAVGGGSTAVTLLRDLSRRMTAWAAPRETACSPGRDLERPGLGPGEMRPPTKREESGVGEMGRRKALVPPEDPVTLRRPVAGWAVLTPLVRAGDLYPRPWSAHPHACLAGRPSAHSLAGLAPTRDNSNTRSPSVGHADTGWVARSGGTQRPTGYVRLTDATARYTPAATVHATHTLPPH